MKYRGIVIERCNCDMDPVTGRQPPGTPRWVIDDAEDENDASHFDTLPAARRWIDKNAVKLGAVDKLCPRCKHLVARHQGGRCSANYTTPNGTVYRCRCDGTAADAHRRVLVDGQQERVTALAQRAARASARSRRRTTASAGSSDGDA